MGGATDWYNNLIALMTRNVAVNLFTFVINRVAGLRWQNQERRIVKALKGYTRPTVRLT